MSSLDKMENFLSLSKEYYNANIKPMLEPDMKGKYIAMSHEVKSIGLVNQ